MLFVSSLGGVTPGSSEYSGDFNSAPNGTIFVAGTNITNAPITGSLRGYLTTYKPHSAYYAQFYIETGSNASKGYFIRGRNSGTWSDWQRVYDTSLLTNQSLLSPLASALGALCPKPLIDGTTSLDDLTVGVWGLNSYTGTNPSPGYFSGVIIHLDTTAFMKIQVAFQYNNSQNNCFVRFYWGSAGWMQWTQI